MYQKSTLKTGTRKPVPVLFLERLTCNLVPTFSGTGIRHQGRLLMGGLGDGSPTISKLGGGLPRKDYTESPFRA